MQNLIKENFGGQVVTLSWMHQDIGTGNLVLNEEPSARFGERVLIDCTGGVSIGPYSVICDDVAIFTHKHDWRGSRGLRRDTNKIVAFELKIGLDVYVSMRSVIVGARSIGDGAVIGVGAIVTHDVPAYEIWAGNPARKIGER